jgi:hypothetical protein
MKRVAVTTLIDVNAGDENHRDENWVECPTCTVDVRTDYDECWQCGQEMEA